MSATLNVAGAATRSRATVGRSILIVAFGSWLIAAAAQVTLPMWPVPVTLQTLAVLLLAAWVGPVRATAAALAYLAQGAAGLPFFALGRGGAAVLVGQTAGYLWAFPVAAYVAGHLLRSGWNRRFLTALAAMSVAEAVILACGTSWLAALVGWKAAWAAGLAPFVLWSVVKTTAAAAIATGVGHRSSKEG